MVNLVIALKKQVTQMIQLVTKQVDIPLVFGDTAKEMALLSNQVKLMKNCLQIKLLTHQVGAVQTKKPVPWSKLLIAARDGDASRVQTLLSAPGVQFYINYTDKDGRTSLLHAVSKGHAPIVEKLIAAGSNINLGQTTDGSSPILIVGHDDVVEKLINAHCNVNIPVTDGSTALSLATRNGHTRIVTMIHN